MSNKIRGTGGEVRSLNNYEPDNSRLNGIVLIAAFTASLILVGDVLGCYSNKTTKEPQKKPTKELGMNSFQQGEEVLTYTLTKEELTKALQGS